jgi:hypothetical protein
MCVRKLRRPAGIKPDPTLETDNPMTNDPLRGLSPAAFFVLSKFRAFVEEIIKLAGLYEARNPTILKLTVDRRTL